MIQGELNVGYFQPSLFSNMQALNLINFPTLAVTSKCSWLAINLNFQRASSELFTCILYSRVCKSSQLPTLDRSSK